MTDDTRWVVRRYRPGKDGSWLRALPAAADPRGPVLDGTHSSWVLAVDDKPRGICTWTASEPLDAGEVLLTRCWLDPEHATVEAARQLLYRMLSEVRKTYRKLDQPLERVISPVDPANSSQALLLDLRFQREVDRLVRAGSTA